MIMRDDDQARLQFLVQLKHELENVLAVPCIQVARRFISENKLRPGDQGACHGSALTFAT